MKHLGSSPLQRGLWCHRVTPPRRVGAATTTTSRIYMDWSASMTMRNVNVASAWPPVMKMSAAASIPPHGLAHG